MMQSSWRNEIQSVVMVAVNIKVLLASLDVTHIRCARHSTEVNAVDMLSPLSTAESLHL